MHPLKYLRPAVFEQLTSPPPEIDGDVVPAVAYGKPAGGETLYILLNPDQDTCVKTRDGAHCKQWECTFLVDAVSLAQAGAMSVTKAESLAEAIITALDNVRMPLGQDLQILSASVENINGGTGYSGEQADIHRYLRVRYTLCLNS